MKAIVILFLFAMIFLCLWKILEPEKSMSDILREIYSTVTDSDIRPPTNQGQQQNQQQNHIIADMRLYQKYSADYVHVGECVWNCLVSLQIKYALDCAGDKGKIFCSEIIDRIKMSGNRLIFTYEIKVNRRPYIKDGTLYSEKIDITAITNAIRANLPAYMCGGYYYTGNVFVWDIGKSMISIEINGVERNINICDGGDIIL